MFQNWCSKSFGYTTGIQSKCTTYLIFNIWTFSNFLSRAGVSSFKKIEPRIEIKLDLTIDMCSIESARFNIDSDKWEST